MHTFSIQRRPLVKLAAAAADSVTPPAMLLTSATLRVPVRSISFSLSAGRTEAAASSASSSNEVTTSATSIPGGQREGEGHNFIFRGF
jgi:hypothetical protein